MTTEKLDTHGYRMPFGKHCGERITRVPVGYLRWMVNNGVRGHDYAKAELERRGTIIPDAEISGHAIDTASLRVLDIWKKTRNEGEGLHAWLVRMVQIALEENNHIMDNRYHCNGMILVIKMGEMFPSLVTVMPQPKAPRSIKTGESDDAASRSDMREM